MKKVRNYGSTKHIGYQRLYAFSKHKLCNVGIPDVEALFSSKAPQDLILPESVQLEGFESFKQDKVWIGG